MWVLILTNFSEFAKLCLLINIKTTPPRSKHTSRDSSNVLPYHCTDNSTEVASTAPSYLPHSDVGVWTVSRAPLSQRLC